MSAFTFNGISIGYPSGCVVSYMGTTEPEGWLFCDGVQRTNGQDGRYNNLIGAKIGSGTINVNYTPPSLIDKFLRGADIATNVGFDTTNKLIGGGSNTVTLKTNNLPSHTHELSFSSAHKHDVTDDGHKHSAKTIDNDKYYWKNGYGDKGVSHIGNNSASGVKVDVTKYGTNIGNNKSGISIKNASCGLTLNNYGKSTEINTVPRYINIFYIIRI